MGIFVRSIGSNITSATPLLPVAGAGWVSGDRSFLYVFGKPDTTTVTTPTGWTLMGKYTGGVGTTAADTGICAVWLYYRDTDPGAGSHSVALSGNNSQSAVIVIMGSTSGWADVPTPTSGGDATAAVGTYTGTGATDLDLDPGDVLVAVHCNPSDTGTITSETLTAASATLLGRAVLSDTLIATGGDHRARVMIADVSAGSSSAGPVHTYTTNVDSSGVTAFFRLRENTPAVPAFPAAVIADSPLVYWRLNGLALEENDSSGNGRHANVAGALTRGTTGAASRPVEGHTPTATSTSGGTTPDAAALDVADVTLMIVAKTVPTGAFQWFGGKYGAVGGANSIALRMNASDVLQVQFRTDTTALAGYDYTGGVAFADGNWHIFHATWGATSDTLRLYIDGALAQSWSVPGTTMFSGSGNVFYGSREPGGDMPDSIDEFAYFGTELSSTRVAAQAAALGFGLVADSSGSRFLSLI